MAVITAIFIFRHSPDEMYLLPDGIQSIL